MTSWRAVLRDLGRLLFFRLPAERWSALGSRHLALGLAATWLAGLGRYWDSPRAEWWQFAGLGSLAYVFVLSGVLWLVLWPVRPGPVPAPCSYRRVLTFVCLTSPPALLYAIPVERFLTLAAATNANVWFLAVVAAWRVGLYGVFLRRALRFDAGRIVITVLLPISAIIVVLFELNLEHAVFELMGGLREEQRSSADGAYAVLFLLTFLAGPAFVVTGAAWLGLLAGRVWRAFAARRGA